MSDGAEAPEGRKEENGTEEVSALGPTFSEVWFDDPAEGEAAQRAALELKQRIEIRATTIRQYLESTVVPLLLQGLQHLVLERPTNPIEYLAAFLLKNNPDPPPNVGNEDSSNLDNDINVAETTTSTSNEANNLVAPKQ